MIDDGNAQLSAVGFFNPLLGGGDAVGVSGGGSSLDGAFGISGKKVVNCYIMMGRTLVSGDDTTLSVLNRQESDPAPSDGTAIYAKVTWSNDEWLLSVHDDGVLDPSNTPAFNKANDLSTAYRILYVYKGGGIVDCRWMPMVMALD